MKRGIIGFVAVTVAVLVGACELAAPTGCTLVGCSSALTIEAPALDAAPFSVVVQSATLNGEVTCPAADADGERGGALEVSGDIVADASGDGDLDRAVVDATCEPRGVRLTVLRRDANDVLPTSATITITSDESTFTADADPIIYDLRQPNGPDCEPTCASATLFAG